MPTLVDTIYEVHSAATANLGTSLMNSISGLDHVEVFSVEFSDEALEAAAAPAKEMVAGYTLQFCTSMDCALVS